jgi:hypothetical protein
MTVIEASCSDRARCTLAVGSAPQTGRCLRAPRHPASAPTDPSQHRRRAKRRPAPSGRASRVRCPTRFAPPWHARSLAPLPGCNPKAGRQPTSRRHQSQWQGLRPPQLVALDCDPYAPLNRNEFDLQRNPDPLASTTSMNRGVSLLWLARTGLGWSRIGSVANRTLCSGATKFMQIAPNSGKRIWNQSTVLGLAPNTPAEIVTPSKPRGRRLPNDKIYVNGD